MMKNLTTEEILQNNDPDLLIQIRRAIVKYDKELAKVTIDRILSSDLNLMDVFNAMTETMTIVGNEFSNDKLFLPDLIAAADVMESVMPVLESAIEKSGQEKKILGKIVIGTVLGDVHTIGKTMVATLLKAAGFEVIDLGVDVSGVKFIEAIRNHIPDILAMSALLTTTAYEQKNVIETLKKEGFRDHVKIMVGGGAVDQEFANSIGADGYEASAPAAANLAKQLLNIS